MRPNERRETGDQDLFRSRPDEIIDMDHALVKLAGFTDQISDYSVMDSFWHCCLDDWPHGTRPSGLFDL